MRADLDKIRVLLGVVVGPLALSGCLYTDTINTPPQAQLEVGDTNRTYFRGTDTIRFNADKSSDLDGDRLFYEFSAELCDPSQVTCARAPELAADRTQLSVDLPSSVPGTELPVGLIRATVIVTDAHNAFSRDEEEWPVASREPTVVLQDQLPDPPYNSADAYTVGEPMFVVAALYDDNQSDRYDISDLTVEWEVTRRPTAAADYVFEEVPIPDSTATNQQRYRLIPDAVGTWEVTVTATDSSGTVGSTSLLINVQGDQPACIGALSPTASYPALVDSGNGLQTFRVLEVIDASDPYPYPAYDPTDPDAGASFEWSIRGPDDTNFTIVGSDTPELAVDPALYLPGDTVEVRINVSDREHSPDCPEGQATCSFDGNTCLQRITWEMEIR